MIFLLYILCLAAIIFFLLILPQQKRKKNHRRLMDALAVGSKVLTVGGLYGVVAEVTENSVVIRGKDGGLLEFDKMAVAKVLS